MKKLVTKMLNVLLASLLVLGTFSSCLPEEDNSSSSSSSSTSSKPETVEKFEPIAYEDNGENIADYQIVVSASADKSTNYSAQILQKRIKQATNADLPIVTDATAEGGLEQSPGL